MKQNAVIKITLIGALIGSSLVTFSGYGIFLILFFYLIIKGEGKKIFSLVLEEKYILLLFFYLILSLFRSNYKVDSLLGFLGIFIAVLIYIVIRKYINSINETKDILKFFVISNIIISTYGIIQFYFIKDSYFSASWIDSSVYNISMRAYSSLLNPNVLSGYLIFCISLQLTALENIKLKKMNVISLILSSFCLILTYSRGAWISLLIILLLTYCYRKKIIYILYSLGFFISLILINGNAGIERISLNNSLNDNSLQYRIEIYRSVLKVIDEHFFFGTGLNTMKNYIHNYSQIINSPVHHAHNLILNILGETGFIGLIIFSMILVGLIKDLYYIYRLEGSFYKDTAVSCFLGFLSIFIHGFVDMPIIAPQFLFFVIYIYAFIINIKDMTASFKRSSHPYCDNRKCSGGEVYETRNISFKKGYFRA
ncbi:MAG: O-antigen ligase family protein [Clostridia bacterium]|nr:O-antigen ligase family protein [Clostridia bacterium]